MTWSSALQRGFRGLLFASIASACPAGEPTHDAIGVEFFEKQVRPLLSTRCLSCHGASKTKGGLRLDARASVLKGGESGPAAVPGKPDESLLIDAVNYGDTLQMPPKSRLPADEVKTLTRWVEMGMPWPVETAKSPAGAEAVFDLKARKDAHWAWQPVVSRPIPDVKNTAWPLAPIDRFLVAGLDAKGLTPAPDAAKRVLLRRLSFDLTGLPPSAAAAEAFENDSAPDAYERLVDRLLASPWFGERWGRHWLDLVRYAETRGHEFDPAIPNAWQYRDYVTRALNLDVPYDRFLTEHIAGDLMDSPRMDPATGGNESILGTGFWFLGEEVHSPVDVRQDETDRLDNRLDVMSKTFLGLTVACARCHDHKFDAISQRDYYALSGFLISSSYRQVRFGSIEREKQAARDLQRIHDEARLRLLRLAARAARPAIERLADDLTAVRDASGSGGASELSPWGRELEKAKQGRAHPLHVFAVVALDRSSCKPDALKTRLTELARPNSPHTDLILKGGTVVVDFGAINVDRSQDGFAFGIRPVRSGDLRVEGEGGKIRVGLFDRPAAHRDPIWNHLSLAEGTQRDHGRLGNWDRSGQTLRSPEFTIQSGRLWYLARGAGRAYASVDSHLLIAGPLHAALLTEWSDGRQGWRWVRHDLSDYQGRRAHVEFSPSDRGSSAVALVVDSKEEPGAIPGQDRAFLRPDGSSAVDSVEALAKHYQSVFARVVQKMETGEFDGPDESGDAALADWILGRPDLFGSEASPERQSLCTELARLAAARDEIARRISTPASTAPAMLDGNSVNEYLLIRGSSKTPGPQVPRRFLEAIAGDQPVGAEGSGRLELARMMTDRSNPFASRVIVNRVWHHLFGRGIVASVDNFGVLGEPPTHPELLDYLADQFVRDGWSIKRLVRSVVLSRAYRMSSRPDSQEIADPDNALVHRMAIRRLEAEPIRDAILAVSGRLEDRMFGPSVPVHLTPYMQGRGRPAVSGKLDGEGRRSLYMEVRRNFLAPMMTAFDAPTPFTTMGRRNASNVPAQALILLNDPFVIEQAGIWAERVLREAAPAPRDRVEEMYRAAFSRPPDRTETAKALDFLEAQGRALGLHGDAWTSDRRVWADLAHMLINSKEFIFLD